MKFEPNHPAPWKKDSCINAFIDFLLTSAFLSTSIVLITSDTNLYLSATAILFNGVEISLLMSTVFKMSEYSLFNSVWIVWLKNFADISFSLLCLCTSSKAYSSYAWPLVFSAVSIYSLCFSLCIYKDIFKKNIAFLYVIYMFLFTFIHNRFENISYVVAEKYHVKRVIFKFDNVKIRFCVPRHPEFSSGSNK